jgi:hypothetical protein
VPTVVKGASIRRRRIGYCRARNLLPLLSVILLGAAEFGRLAYASIEVANMGATRPRAPVRQVQRCGSPEAIASNAATQSPHSEMAGRIAGRQRAVRDFPIPRMAEVRKLRCEEG